MLILFGVLAGVGVVFVLVGVLSGVDLDLGVGDSGAFSLPVVGALLGAGGLAGVIGTLAGWSPLIAALVAVAAGLLAWAPVFALSRRLRRSEDTGTIIRDADFVGGLAEMIHPATAGRPGLADVTVRGERLRKRVVGRDGTDLVAGAHVVVVDQSDGTLVAEPAPDWMVGREHS